MTTTTIGTGQTSSGITIAPGDIIQVTSGGTAFAMTTAGQSSVGSGGILQLLRSGFASGTVDHGGVVVSGATTIGTLVSGVGAYELATANGLTSSSIVTFGNETVTNGAVTLRTLISGTVTSVAEDLHVPGRLPPAPTIIYGATATIASGGEMIAPTVTDASLTVQSGGRVSYLTALGGSSIVVSGGTLVSSTIDSSSTLTLTGSPMGGGYLSDIILQNGAVLDDQLIRYTSTVSARIDPASKFLIVSQGGTSSAIKLAGFVSGQAVLAFPDDSGGTNLVITPTSGTQVFGPLGTSLAVAGDNNAITLPGTIKAVYTGAGAGTALSVAGQAAILTQAGGSARIALGGYSEVAGDGNNTIFGGSGGVRVTGGAGTDLVVGGAGLTTVVGGFGSNVVFGGLGGLAYTGGRGADTVVAGSAAATIFGGTGGGTYFGGGKSVISAGTGAQQVLVGSDGDKLYSNGPAGDLFGVLGGSVTMDGSRSTGNDVFFGAAGTGALTFITGSGNDLLAMGQGTNTVTLGSGTNAVFGNARATSTTITIGTGAAAIALAGQTTVINADLFSAKNGSVALYNFVPGLAHINLGTVNSGYVSAFIQQQTNVNGSAVVNFGNLAFTFIGVAKVDESAFR